MRRLLLLLLLASSAPAARAQWIWSPDTGWINSRYTGAADAKALLARARKLEQGGKHADASRAFEKIAQQHPQSGSGREALFAAAENKFRAGEHYAANQLYESYLDRYQKDRQHQTITQRRYEIARALVRGEKRKLLGFKLLSDESKGEEILRSIIAEYPFEKQAELPPDDVTDDAMFVLGNYYYREKRYEEADAIYRKLREKFPRSEWAPAALYKIALCQKAQGAGARYDTQPLVAAKKTAAEYREKVPEGTEVQQAKKLIDEVEQTLADKALQTALFYQRRGRTRAARLYAERLLRKHPKSRAAARAKSLLAEIK